MLRHFVVGSGRGRALGKVPPDPDHDAVVEENVDKGATDVRGAEAVHEEVESEPHELEVVGDRAEHAEAHFLLPLWRDRQG